MPADDREGSKIAREFYAVTSKSPVNSLPCRAVDKVSAELRPFCLSLVDPDRPGRYLVHRDGDLVFEPKYAASNPDTFDDDASFIVRADLFFAGFDAFESLNRPNHFFLASPDDKLVLSEFNDTPEFRQRASMTLIRRDIKGEFTC